MNAQEFRSLLKESQEKGLSIKEVISLRENANKQAKKRKPMNHIEHDIQVQCVNWFREQYPTHQLDLFAIGNGGKRDAVTGAFMKEEGVTAGVADLCLAVPRNGHGCLFIEMKTKTGKQQPTQIAFEQSTTRAGNVYKICRSLSDFKKTVKEYLKIQS